MSIKRFDQNGRFRVLVNSEEQHGLWPTLADVPTGWRTADGVANPVTCLDHIELNWTDTRPGILREGLLAGRSADR
ncbi:MbtH family protein [Mycobacterium sp. E2479]|uniref:MbtH family protein n=1 Tax=Mycobacterium sp. E2479 TaxID=1834134 RepID=UPI0007FBCF13|nr:MbtH family protein [Mycobacterium sp. E2479]OBH53051.1 protein mbtH [Mycobacterium sp. E2479]